MSAPNPGPQVGDQLTGEQCDALPVGSVVVLAVDLDGPVPAPPSAVLRFADGWRGPKPGDGADDLPGTTLFAPFSFRVLYVGRPDEP